MANKTLNNVKINMTLKSTTTRARLSTSSEDLAVQMGKINKWYDSLVPTGGESGNILGWNSDGTAKWVTVAPSANKLNISSAVGGTTQPVYFKADGTPEAISFTIGKSVPANAIFTDQNVKSTLLSQSTAEASYRPTFVTGATTGGVYIIDSYKVNHTPGTTGVVGNTRLVLGNATASGTANNEEGQLKLYSSGTAFHTLKGTTISSEVIHVLPSTGGTILNDQTTSYTQTSPSSATGAYEIGKIKINGTTTTLYGKDTGTAYTASDGIKIESNVIKHTNAIDEVTTPGFYKFKFDAQGHITGTASVAPGDIPPLNYVPNTNAGVNAAINLLSTGTSTPTDDDYYISQYVGGGTTTTTYHRRPMSALWSYVKGKADSTYLPIGHTYPLSIAADSGSGTSQLTLSPGTKYKLTAGGSSFIFTTSSYSAGTGISLSGTTFSNTGVRSTTINGNYLRVNTNGTNADLTIPYATTASKLGSSTVGSGSRPIYLNAGTATQCDTPSSGAYWTGVPYIASNGVMEVGKYIDFHGTNTSTNDYDYRIAAETQVLYFAPKSSGDATYNLIRMQSPDYNQIQFQTTKSGKAYIATGIVVYPLTTSGQTMLIQSDGNTVIGGGESPRTLYSNSYDNMDTAENETLYLTSDSAEIHLITNLQSYSGRKVLKVQDGQLVKSGGQWIAARDVAPVYANKPNTQDGAYYPAWFAKTKSGGWSMGVLSHADNLYITYTTDEDYSEGNNDNTYTIQFQNKTGTIALLSDLTKYYDSTISRTANTVLAAPNGSNGVATFRKLVAADIPDLNYVKTAYNQGTYGTDYGILFTNPISASTDTGGYAYRNGEMRAKFRPPATSARGWAEILLGNAETTNATGSTGWIGIYNSAGKLTELGVADGSSDTTQYFPNVSGTILNSGTTSFTQTLSSGTKIGSIKINGSSTDIYAPTAPTVNNASLTLKGAGTTVTTFTANASTNQSLDIVAGSNVTITPDATNHKITIASSYTNTDTKVYQSSTTTSDFRPVLFGKNNQTNPENLETAVTDQAFVTKRIFAQPSTGNLYLYSATGDSPALVFRRGTLIDNLNDWKIYVSSGALYFDQSTANASSETWTHKMYLHSSDGKLYVGSSAVSVEGHTHNYAGSSSAGGAATSANKLNTNAGTIANPVYFTNGVPTACDYPKSGAWAPTNGGVPVVTSSGVLEIGPYIDFHSKTSTVDYDLRLSEESTNLLALKNTSPTFRIHSTSHTDVALELWREGDGYTDYRIINTGGQFKIQSDYIEGTGHTDWFDMLHLAYTTGNATFKGTGTFGGSISSPGATFTTNTFGSQLILEMSGSANYASICFKNNTGVLGYMGMTSANGGLYRIHTNTSDTHLILDAGNYTSYTYSSKATRTANTVLAGPASGDAAVATFRKLVAADIPTGINITGNAKTTGTRWTAVSQGQKWSRLYYVSAVNGVEGTSGILSISATRGNTVFNATFLITSSHAGSRYVHCIELDSCNYSQIKVRTVCKSDATYYFEIYDTASSIAAGTTQNWHCCFVPFAGTNITTYTTFTDGSTIPSGYSATNEFTTTAHAITMPYNAGGKVVFDGGTGMTITAPTDSGWARGIDYYVGSTWYGGFGAHGPKAAFQSLYIGKYDDEAVSINPSNKTSTFYGIITAYRESSTTDNLPAGIVFSNNDTTTGLTSSGAHIYAYNDHANPTYGENLVINAGGCLFIGAGESADNHYAAIKSGLSTSEDIYMTADRYVYIQGCGDAIAARKGMMVYTTDSYHQILPTVADTATNNVGSIGSSSYKWHEMYAANYYGEFDCSNEVANSTSYAMVLAMHPDTHEPNTLRKTPNAIITFKNGTASEEGWAQITLGNETKSGTAGNSTGWLKLFSPSSGAHYITGASTTSAITHTLPTVGGTLLNSGNYLQYTRSIQKLYAATSTKGWRRILTVPAMNSSGYTIGRYEFHFTRQWNNGAPESFGVRVICNYTTPIIHLLYAEQYTRILTDFRVTRSSDSTKIHFEVWYDATSKNDFSVRYVIQDPYLIPHDFCTFPTETDGSSAGSSFLPVVSDSPTAQATIPIPVGGISQFNLRQVAGSYSGYFGMADAAGSDSAWIRTTSQGLLPYSASSATNVGSCSIGTSGWYFKDAYIGKVVSNTADFECFQPRHSNEFSMKEITYNYIWFNYRLITDDNQGYTTEPTKPINQYWFGCGRARNALAKVVTSGMTIYPGAANTTSYSTTLQSASLTANRTATLPNATGTIPLITEKYNNPSSAATSYNLTYAATFKLLMITTKPSSSLFGETTVIVPAPTAAGTTKTYVNWPGHIAEASSQPTRTLGGYIRIQYSNSDTCTVDCVLADYYLQAGSSVSSGSTSGFNVYITRIIGISY